MDLKTVNVKGKDYVDVPRVVIKKIYMYERNGINISSHTVLVHFSYFLLHFTILYTFFLVVLISLCIVVGG